MTSVQAGEVEAVHASTIANLHRQQLVDVEGQSDVVIFGLPHVGPYNVNSIMNPHARDVHEPGLLVQLLRR